MANKKSPQPKKKKRKPPKKDHLKTHFKRSLTGLFVLLAIVVSAGVIAHYLLRPQKPPLSEIKPPTAPPPRFEIYPKEDILPPKPAGKPLPGVAAKLPKVAIIIDDIGYDHRIAEKFLDLDVDLTFSMLPHISFSKSFARSALQKGHDVMLHLPMEPNEYPAVDPGPGALLTSMSPDELISQLEMDLDDIPGIKGVNNHMGSKMTAVSNQLYQIFTVLKQRNLFFIDSRTTPETLCKPSARLFQVPFSQRDVFIDHTLEPEKIRQQLDHLVQIAKTHGEAVGIAHPHALTYKILREVLPELQKNVQLVPASQIVHLVS